VLGLLHFEALGNGDTWEDARGSSSSNDDVQVTTAAESGGGSKSDHVMIIGSQAATAVLVFNAINSPLAQPRNVIGGNMISALVGVAWQVKLRLPPPAEESSSRPCNGNSSAVQPSARACAALQYVHKHVCYLLPPDCVRVRHIVVTIFTTFNLHNTRTACWNCAVLPLLRALVLFHVCPP
jgi:hypothetical protein